MTYDGGFLILSPKEREEFIKSEPPSEKFIRPILNSSDFFKSNSRYCIWIREPEIQEALSITCIRKRIEKVKKHREGGGQVAKSLASQPYQFRYPKEAKTVIFSIPIVSSERREYIPVGVLPANTVISNACYGIYDSEPWVFAVVSSKLHNVWMRAVAGRMKTDIRYSSELCYNTFPFPEITEAQKEILNRHTRNVIREREQHSEKTIAELYDPDKMPEDLRRIHKALDEEVEMCYGLGRPFHNDEERLTHLFKLYEEMIAKEQTPLFATQKKQRKSKRNA